MTFFEAFQLPMQYLLDPGQRVFFLYWLFAFFAAGALLIIQKRMTLKRTTKILLDSRVWTHPSALLDFQLLVFNVFLKSLLLSGTLISSLMIAKHVVRSLTQLLGTPTLIIESGIWLIGAYTLVHFIFLDFTRFLQHYIFHKVPFLWDIHKVHHSAEVLNPVTLYRTHPLESLISALRQMLVIGMISGFFIYFSQGRIDVWTILGVNGLDFLFNFAASNLRHSHIWMSFGPLNRVFVSPAHHQVHHSRAPRHMNKNLGFSLSVWDQLFGTYYEVRKKEFLCFGVRGEKDHRFLHNLLLPIRFPAISSTSRELEKNSKKGTLPRFSKSFQMVIR